MSFSVWLFVAPFDKVEVEPSFVMATLVSRADIQHFLCDWTSVTSAVVFGLWPWSKNILELFGDLLWLK